MPQKPAVDNYEVTLDDGEKVMIPIGKDVPESRIPDIIEGSIRARQRIKKGFASQPNIGPEGFIKPPNIPPTPDVERTPGQVALDQMTNVVMGGPRQAAAAGSSIMDLIRSKGAGLGTAVKETLSQPLGVMQGPVEGAVNMVKPIAQFLGQHLQQTMGPTPTNLAAGGPVPIEPPPPDSPEWKQSAEGAGAMLEGALAGKTIGGGLGKFKARLAANAPNVPPEVSAMENKLAPTGNGARLMARDAAPEIAKDPDLVRAHGTEFDKALVKKFQEAGNDVQTTEAKIPDATPVNIEKPIQGFSDLIDEYTASASDEAVRALTNYANRLSRFEGGTMPWDQFIEIKRTIGNTLRNNGVWKRIAADTATEKDIALSRAYGKLVETADETARAAGSDLPVKNRKFRVMNDAIHAAGIETETGRRIKTIGTPAPSKLMKAAKIAAPLAAGAAAGAAGARAVRGIQQMIPD